MLARTLTEVFEFVVVQPEGMGYAAYAQARGQMGGSPPELSRQAAVRGVCLTPGVELALQGVEVCGGESGSSPRGRCFPADTDPSGGRPTPHAFLPK